MMTVSCTDCNRHLCRVDNGSRETFATSLPCAVKNCSHRPAESESNTDYDTQMKAGSDVED